MRYAAIMIIVAAAALVGCGPPARKKEASAAQAAPKQQPVFGKKTRKVEKYDPADAAWRVADLNVKYTNPVTGALEAYGPLMAQVSTMGVDHSVALFQATKGKFPTYREFMDEIVNNPQGGLDFPVLPALAEYRYDEATHKLVVVIPAKAPAAPSK